MSSSSSSTAGHTCISCHVVFANADLQRQHYKSDWHRYNLKRKIVELPPVTKDAFEQRVRLQAAQNDQAILDAQKPTLYCAQCRKSFRNNNAYENHVKSKKHQETKLKDAINIGSPVKTTPVIQDDKTVQKSSSSQKQSMQDSSKKPVSSKAPMEFSDAADSDDSEWESCSDDDDEEIEGEQEEEGIMLQPNECLFCSALSPSLESNIEHMTLQHSFFIPDVEYLVDLEGLIAYLGEKVGVGHRCLWCCDKGKAFHSTKAVQQHMIDKGHCKLLHEGETLLEYADFYDYSSSYPQGEGEGDADTEISIPELDDSGWQLVLPSGAVIGHRSLARYYKQSLPPERPKQNQKSLHHLMSQYKALGWTGTSGPVAVQKARDIKFLKKIRDRQHLKLGVKHNKLQPHFRPQVMF